MEYSNKIIEDIMKRFKPIIGTDYEKYRNHVYRVFSNCGLFDNEKSNEEKYAIAAVFHDIGIWTDNTFDYLDPSIAQVKIYLTEIDRKNWADELTSMIYWHHKTTYYKGAYAKTTESFRKADWIDVSLALLSFGADSNKIKKIKQEFPNLGFHFFLLKQILKNLFKHPLNPLPVFKK